MACLFGLRQHLLPWLVLGGVTLLQSVSGTRFIYSTCSNLMQQHYRISRFQLNNLVVASESGRLFGWVSNAAAEHLPAPMVLVIGLILGSLGYGVQYLCITNHSPSLSYWQMLLLNVLAGNSICWINTYCRLITSKSFKNDCNTITAITSSYCGLSGKIYTSLVEGIQGRKGESQDSSMYLLFACLGPILFGLPVTLLNCLEVVEYEETKVLPFVFLVVIATGVYAVVESIAQPFRQLSPRLRVVNLALVALMLPLVVAFLTAAANQLTILLAKWDSKIMPEEPSSIVTDAKSSSKTNRVGNEGHKIVIEDEREGNEKKEEAENWLKEVVKSVDFWLFYWMNMCGATLGMVYLNNLEIISELLSYHDASSLLATSSSYGFFGRIFSAIFTWYTRENSLISKPALIMLMMLPMPVAFFLLVSSSGNMSLLYISTGIIGSSSGAMNDMIASTSRSELLISLSNSVVHQTILPTNIPIGTLLFGHLAAALNYQRDVHTICIWGLKCHQITFIIWGCACSIATFLSFSLYLRSRKINLQRS